MIEQLKIRNWRIAQAIRKAQEKYKALAAAEAEMGRVVPVTPYAPLGDVDEEERRFIQSVNDKQAWRNIQAHPGWNMARWKERDYAELKQWEAQQAQSAHTFAGVSAGGGSKPLASLASDDPPNLWERIVNWADEHIVQPAVNAYNQTVTGVKNFVNNTVTWTNEHIVKPMVNAYNQTVAGVKNFVNNTVTWTNEHIVKPAVNAYNQTVTTIQNFATNTYL